MCLLPTRILAQGAAVAQAKKRSYCYAKSYVLSCSFGRSRPRFYLYADEGTKSRISISRLSTRVRAVANISHASGATITCTSNQVSQGSESRSKQIHCRAE